MELVRVAWEERDWRAALDELRARAANWRGAWVFVQYTALAWSRRGFPRRFVRVLRVLRQAGAKTAAVFHDVEPFAGSRIVDRLRRRMQVRAMREATWLADLAVFTVSIEKISWLKSDGDKFVFIPVGANLPLAEKNSDPPRRAGGTRTVAVFGITGGEAGRRESEVIAEAMRFAAERIPKLRLCAFGRHADEAEAFLREGVRDVGVDVDIAGVLPGERIAQNLSSADVLLFVRGAISSRRGSGIAGIACGLPVVAFSGTETAAPITEAGVVLVPPGDKNGLGEALARVLSDQEHREALAERSRRAYELHFSWKAIAARYAEAMGRKVTRDD